jgi:hypothetical protein
MSSVGIDELSSSIRCVREAIRTAGIGPQLKLDSPCD